MNPVVNAVPSLKLQAQRARVQAAITVADTREVIEESRRLVEESQKLVRRTRWQANDRAMSLEMMNYRP